MVESDFLTLFPRSLAQSAEGLRVLTVDFEQAARSIGVMSLKYRTLGALGALGRLFVEEAVGVARALYGVATLRC